MKTIILIITFLCSVFCYGQTFSVNNFNGTKWKMADTKGWSWTWEFSKSEIKTGTNYDTTKPHDIRYKTIPYYISKTIPKSFDKSKLNSLVKGKYLILKSKIGSREVFRIDYLSSDTLKLFYIYNGGPVIGGVTTNYVFKRIKK